MKITKIEVQVKAKGRYSIFLDDVFAFGLSELGLIESGIRVGQEINEQELSVLKDDAKTDKLYNYTLGLIARRPRSEWEISDYLKRKELDEQAAATIIDKLRSKGFIDDYDFAKRWVESRRLLKSISKRKLEVELRQKRLSDAVIKQVLSEDQADEYDVLLIEVAKKRRQSRYHDNTKLMQYLARQGYGYDDIKRALAAEETN